MVSPDILENKSYSPQEVEAKWAKYWYENKLFAVQIHPETKNSSDKKPFSIALPPPNVTGELHMGHALSGSIQDVLIRLNRMQGKDVLWQIGTDHAGIGTQIVVEKFLKKNEHITKYDLGREKFIERTKKWKEEYGNKILEQMRVLGFSPDWDRCRYTMDEHYSHAVKNAFKKYFNDGLIYRGKRITNWCPKCKTSLSDLEIDKEEVSGKLYHIKYPIKGSGEFITVATTRPETMFGDTGVAVHPDDERYKKHIKAGVRIILPLANREIPLVADDHIKMEFGTGAVKVTPAHDPNDFEIANRHKLPRLVIMDDEAKLLALDFIPEELHGLERFAAREKTLELLGSEELIEKTSDYNKEKDSHDRCHTEIEPYLTNQWYLAMAKLAQIALDTVNSGKSEFIPKRYEIIFKNWLENIKDWCISRQIWWGHRIPVFYYLHKTENPREEQHSFAISYFSYSGEESELFDILPNSVNADKENFLKFLKETTLTIDFNDSATEAFSSPSVNVSFSHKIEKSNFEDFKNKCQDDLVSYFWQDEDVLDTWFSSALWPSETLKAGPDNKKTPEVFNHFYPTSVLATAREIINLWVSRMIFSSEYFEGVEPFKDIIIHPVVQTPDGKRMSKSKGNAIDPLEMVAQYGADASRMWYASASIHGPQDLRFPGKYDKSKNQWESDALDQYKKFANKLFNASKFVMMSLGDDFKPKKIEKFDNEFSTKDRWILDKFHNFLSNWEKRDDYDISFLANGIYEFLWFSFCDWYIEFSKNEIKDATKQVLFHLLEASLRVLHPIMPFITEEIWQILHSKYDFSEIKDEVFNSGLDKKYQDSICFSQFPKAKTQYVENRLVDYIIELVSAIRNTRQTLGIPWTKDIELYLRTDGSNDSEDYYEMNQDPELQNDLKKFGKVSKIILNSEAPKPSTALVIGKTKITIPLAGLADISKVQEKTLRKIASLERDINELQGRLNSENFIKNADSEKIQETRNQLKKIIFKKSIYEKELETLRPGK